MAWFSKAAGIALACAAAFGWLSLMSWSVHDPSLTHATSGATRNWLGPPGAIVSDLLLQAVGLAAIFVFLACAAAGCRAALARAHSRMAHARRPAGSRRCCFSPARSRRCRTGGWPLHHGLGGIFGDATFAVSPPAFCRPSWARGRRAGRAASVRGAACALGHGRLASRSASWHCCGSSRRQWRRASADSAPNWLAGMAATLAEARHERDSSPGCGPSRATARLAGSCERGPAAGTCTDDQSGREADFDRVHRSREPRDGGALRAGWRGAGAEARRCHPERAHAAAILPSHPTSVPRSTS